MLVKKYMIWSTKRFARGATRAMLLSCEMLRGKNIDVNFYSDYAKQALSLRPGWKQLSQAFFEHKSGNGIIINNEDSIKQVIQKVVEVEMINEISGNPNSDYLVKIALEEIEKYFLKK